MLKLLLNFGGNATKCGRVTSWLNEKLSQDIIDTFNIIGDHLRFSEDEGRR